MNQEQSVLRGRLVVGLLVGLLITNVFVLVGVYVINPPAPCAALVVLKEIVVGQDTDPNPVYGPTDRWNGTFNITLAGSRAIATKQVWVDFAGDRGHAEVLNAVVIRTEVGDKGETIDFLFDSEMVERDGPPYGGPAPLDIDVLHPATGSLHCPGAYALDFPRLIAPLNNGEVETGGWLTFSFTVVLDP